MDYLNNEQLISFRIQELISEIEQCREDGRNSDNQILSVITTAGTILGVLVGASYLSQPDINNQPLHSSSPNNILLKLIIGLATNTRVFFWLTCFVFDAAFLYIISIGIKNVLRYYHLLDLQDRLHDLLNDLPDDDGRGVLLGYNEFSAPIVTMNLRHLSSSHSALHYFAYGMGAVFTILFSVGIVFSQYAMIDNYRVLDRIVFYSTMCLMIGTIFLFIRLTSHARLVAQFAWDTAHENKKIRDDMARESRIDPNNVVKDRTYTRSKLFLYRVKYVFYPKLSDWYKAGIELIGFIWCLVSYDRFNIHVLDNRIWPLLLSLVTFEFLAYQIRYQINDIKGIEEDRQAGKENKLIPDWIRLKKEDNTYEQDVKQSVQISLKCIGVKALFAVIFSIVLLMKYKIYMIGYIFVLALITIAYEWARSKESTFGIFLTVGLGYPLRFIVGANAAKEAFFFGLNIEFIIITLLLILCGIFASILSWTSEVVNMMEKSYSSTGQLPGLYKKSHYNYLQNILKDRYLELRNEAPSKAKHILRVCCKLYDPWNIVMVLTIILSLVGQYLFIRSEFVLVLCLLADMALFFSLISSEIVFLSCNIIAIFFYLLSVAVGLYFQVLNDEAAAIIILESINAVVYFVLRYRPQIHLYSVSEVAECLMRKILGDDICDNFLL